MKYKKYDHITVKQDGYTGSIYKDNMFGMEFTSFSLYNKDGKEIMHATLNNERKYTKDDVRELINMHFNLKKEVEEKK